MIREFDKKDLENFKANKNGDARDIMFVFNDPSYFKYTLDHGGPKAIICFRHNGDDDWAGFFLIAENFTARDGILVKRFIEETVRRYRPKRLWTASHINEDLNRWHKFLGMKIEDTLVIHGKKCAIWSIRWERKK